MTVTRLLRIARQRLGVVIRPRAVEREIELELALHLDALTQEKVAAGLTEADARREALREFGALDRIVEQSCDARGVSAVDGIVSDARYGWRLLRRTPGFTAVAGLALSIGIGATAAAAGAVAFVLARPLPFADGDRLITVRTAPTNAAVFARALTLHQYHAWQSKARTIIAIGAARGSNHVLSEDGRESIGVQTQAYTPSLFALAGARPLAGRFFEAVDNPFDRRALVAVISERLWRQRYHGDPGAIGRRIRFDGGASRAIVGVLPDAFRIHSENVDVWIPLVASPESAHVPAHDAPQLQVTARLREGATIADARAELQAIASGLHPDRVPPSIEVDTLRETLYGWTRPRLLTLAVTAALLLTLACANVAALLLARGALRRRELAMRMALGAPRERLIRQLLTESVVIGLSAAIPAAVIAWMGMRAVSGALGPPPGLPRLVAPAMDGWVLVIIGALSVLSSLAFGIVPAVTVTRAGLKDALLPARGRLTSANAGARWRGGLVAVQIALAQLVVIAAALLTISYLRLSGRELNFEPRGLLSFTYTLRAADVIRPLPQGDGAPAFEISPDAAGTMARLLERLQRIPNAGIVGALSFPPVNSLVMPIVPVQTVDGNGTAGGRRTMAAIFYTTPNAFAALRAPILDGREFDGRDGRDGPPTIVINETMARLCCAGASAVGQRLRVETDEHDRTREIVGVVADVPTRLDQATPSPVIYVSYLQQPQYYRGPAVGMFASMTFVMRPSADAGSVLTAARGAAAAITPDRPVDAALTVQAHLNARLAERRNYVLAVDAFALLATLLAVLGLHGLMTHAVVARADEIAVRKALGAGWPAIVTLVARPPLPIVAAGITLGLAGGLAASTLLAPQLWGVAARDLSTFTGVTIALGCAAGAGGIAAVRRALGIDPIDRLRCD